MRLSPAAPAAVVIAEQKLEQSKQQLYRQLDQARSTLAQPSNLFIVTGIGTLLGIWSARRKKSVATSGGASPASFVRSLVLAFLIRFVAQRIAEQVQQYAQARLDRNKAS